MKSLGAGTAHYSFLMEGKRNKHTTIKSKAVEINNMHPKQQGHTWKFVKTSFSSGVLGSYFFPGDVKCYYLVVYQYIYNLY